MSDEQDLANKLDLKKSKIIEQKQKFAQEKAEVSWKAVARPKPVTGSDSDSSTSPSWIPKIVPNIDFHGKNLQNGDFSDENLEDANLSGADLRNANLSGANLRGIDLSGADLTGANLEGADLTGANLSGAKLIKANLKKTKLHNVIFDGADLTDAVFLEIDVDNPTLENIQDIVEYLAVYYPHKLNLAKFDLTLLNLAQIDLSRVNLRGVDFTGADFTGVNILELDLSECIITPEQIAQALGHQPSPEELRKILAPKPKKKHKSYGIDMTDFFFDNGLPAGVWFTHRGKAVTFDQIFGAVKRFTNAFRKDAPENDLLEDIKQEKKLAKQEAEQEKSANEDLRKIIEENKKNTLEEKMRENTQKQQKEEQLKPKTPQHVDNIMIRRGDSSRGF